MRTNEKLWCIRVIIKRYFPFWCILKFDPSTLFLSVAALKTQPYDLLRWSAAYFRCLSLDVLPPVKPRYEHENVFGCLTKGFLKVLLSQVRLGRRFGSCHVPHFHGFYQIHVCLSSKAPFNYDSCVSIYTKCFDASFLVACGAILLQQINSLLTSICFRFKVGKGFFVRRDILEHRWNGLCLPEVPFIKACKLFSLTLLALKQIIHRVHFFPFPSRFAFLLSTFELFFSHSCSIQV